MDLSQIKPLTYGAIKKNKTTVDALTASTEGLTRAQFTERSVDFLKLAFAEAADEDFEVFAPGVLEHAAFAIYKATFSRPEEPAPAQ